MNIDLDLNVTGSVTADEVKANTVTAATFVQTGGSTLTFDSLDVTNTLDVGGLSTLDSANVTNALNAGSLGITGPASFDVLPLSSDASAPAATSLVTRNYVDSEIVAHVQGLHPRPLVNAASTGPLTLSGLQTVDGVALGDGDRVLVKDQADATQNSIYEAHAGAWTVAPDMSGVVTSAYVFVQYGNTWNDSSWVQNNEGSAGIAQAWTLFSVIVPQAVNLSTATTASNVTVQNTAGNNAVIIEASVAGARAGVMTSAQARRVTELQLLYSAATGAGTVIYDMALGGGATDTIMVTTKGMAYAPSTGEVVAVDEWGILHIDGGGDLSYVKAVGVSSAEVVISATTSNFSLVLNFGSAIARTGFFSVSMFSIATGAPITPPGGFAGPNVTEL